MSFNNARDKFKELQKLATSYYLDVNSNPIVHDVAANTILQKTIF